MAPQNASHLSRALLNWYDASRRAFPWRAEPGETPDPYRVWLSEIMLQQTGAATVIPYFEKFTARWPDVKALAAAELDDVLTAWSGLGYYARARNLRRCAHIVSAEMNGEFPRAFEALLKLPGIGPYTAAAIAAIAYGQPGGVLDGNIERVVARLHAMTAPLPAARAELQKLSAALIDCARPGDVAQAMMDLGATICTPRKPGCAQCPWQSACQARRLGIAASLPRKRPKPASPLRVGAVFWLVRKDGAVLLRRRPEKGLLGGMMEFPGAPWGGAPCDIAAHAPAACAWRPLPGTVRHVFTHFKLELTVYSGACGKSSAPGGVWAQPDTLENFALPALMRKVAIHAQKHSQ